MQSNSITRQIDICAESYQGHIGIGNPSYRIAELSANHQQDFEKAIKLLEVAEKTDADAVKLQTYTPDTVSIGCADGSFRIGKDIVWEKARRYYRRLDHD